MINFLLGMSFILIVMPVLEGLANLILTLFEVCKTKLGVIITRDAKTIKNIEESQEVVRHVIGFGIPNEEQYEEDEEDDI